MRRPRFANPFNKDIHAPCKAGMTTTFCDGHIGVGQRAFSTMLIGRNLPRHNAGYQQDPHVTIFSNIKMEQGLPGQRRLEQLRVMESPLGCDHAVNRAIHCGKSMIAPIFSACIHKPRFGRRSSNESDPVTAKRGRRPGDQPRIGVAPGPFERRSRASKSGIAPKLGCQPAGGRWRHRRFWRNLRRRAISGALCSCRSVYMRSKSLRLSGYDFVAAELQCGPHPAVAEHVLFAALEEL